MKYTISDLRQDFPDEDACLEWIINWLYPDGITCKKCEVVTKHYKMKNRKSYSCGVCGWHFHPTAGTIFHKSSTPLTAWMYAMFLMANSKCGMSAAQVQRQLGVTYKTAWRMMHKIREQMAESEGKLEGQVEIDETYIHGNVYKRSTAQQRYGRTGSRQGQIVFGMAERNGKARLIHVKSAGVRVLVPQIEANIKFGSIIYSDDFSAYWSLHRRGYRHFSTNHSRGERVLGENHNQNIENVWSHLKLGLKAIYRSVSPRHLQKYCDEYGFRYSYRNHVSLFWALWVRALPRLS